MNIEKKLRRAFRRATPNVLGSLPAQDPAAKRRKHLPERAVRMIATAASFVILIGAATWGLLYFRDHFSGPIIHSGNTTPTTAPTQPTETVPPTDPQSPISREEALQIARTDAFGSITPAHTVAHAELQDEGSSAVYYIVLDDSARIYHYWIDGYSGAILQQQETAILYPVEAYERVMDAEPALAASLHTSVVRLYQDNNRYRYYVELQTDTEIHAFHVDALTGEIADRTVLSLETGIGWKGARDLAFAEKGATPETAEYWDIMLLSRDDAPMYRVCYKFDGYYYEATVGTDPDTATAQITHYEDIDFPQEPLPGNHVSWQEARDTLMDSLGLSMDSLSGFDIVDTDASVYSFTFQHEEDMHAYLVPAYDTSKMNGGILPQAHLPMTEIRLRDLALDSVGASLEELWYLETSQEEDQRLYYVSFRCGNRSYFCEVSQDNHISVDPRENPDTPPPGEGTADIVTWQTARDAALAAYGVQMQDIIDIDIGFSTAEARPIYTVSFQCGDESHTCTVDAQSGKVIDPNNPPEPEPLKVSDWQLDVEIVDHDAYFSEERYYINWFVNDLEWLKERNDGTYFFKAKLADAGIVISCEALSGVYTVPDSAKYAGGSLLATDGCSAWVCFAEQILRIDMATGTAEIVLKVEGLELLSVLDNAVAYYVCYDNAQNLTIGQLYLPDGHHEVLHQQQIDTYILGCDWLKSSNGTFAISMYNPEMLEAIRQELANPNSPYMKGDQFDYSEIWEQEDALDRLLGRYFWQEYFQTETGIRTYLKIYCDLSTGKVTQKTGIIDSCMYGSGYPHDHFSPEITTTDEPVASISGWRDLDLAGWNSSNYEEDFGSYRIVADTLSRGTLCWISDGKVQIVLDTPVVAVRKADRFFICVTTDQRILQVSFDGGCIRELYKATNGKIDEVSISGTHVFFTDGDTIMELDLENDRVRSVLQHPHLLESYFYGEEYDPAGKNRVYFAIRNGMFYQQYIVDLETGEIEETSFL